MKIRFGYVAMSEVLQNASPSQTMTVTQFEKIGNHEGAIRKLERIAVSNLENCLRLLKHNAANDISFFRLSSRLVPLVNHPLTEGWKYEKAILPQLRMLGKFIKEHEMRVDFHPDHFVILNNQSEEILSRSLKTLLYHYKLLKGMNIDPAQRCVLHIGGKKEGKVSGLETFIENFSTIPTEIQKMIMLENDDTSYTLEDTLYLGEKLGVPVVFDLHHHDLLASDTPFATLWERVISLWEKSPLPIKMHISSPFDGENDKRHHDYIDTERLLSFFHLIEGSVDKIDIMIEAKKKDKALFRLMKELEKNRFCRAVSQASIEFCSSSI